MDAIGILHWGHDWLMRQVNDMTEEGWAVPAVGTWTARDVLAHLASYELLLSEVLAPFAGTTAPTDLMPTFDAGFNDREVAKRSGMTWQEIRAEYTEAYKRASGIAASVPRDRWPEVGTIPWYGPDYALDDLLVFPWYGHKREHGAQIAGAKDRAMADAVADAAAV